MQRLIILNKDIGKSRESKELLFYSNSVLFFPLNFLTRGYFLNKILKSFKL